jgi:hypothetical protein
MIFSAALWGCGAHSGLEVGEGASGSGTETGAGGSTTSASTTAGSTAGILGRNCSPSDGEAIGLYIDGTTSCLSPVSLGGLSFLVWGRDLQNLHAGSTLSVMPGVNATTKGARVSAVGKPSVPMTGGTLTFTTYAMGQGGTGTYAVTFEDGSSAQGSFDAVWCAGSAQCG